MTREEFDAKLAALNLTRPVFARLTNLHVVTVRGWGQERQNGSGERQVQAVPGWVPSLLEAWAGAPHILAERMRLLRETASS